MTRTAATAGMGLAAIVALYGCAAHHQKPLPSDRVVAMPPIPNPPVVVQPKAESAAPIARQYDATSKRALEYVVQPDTKAGVIVELRKRDAKARAALANAEKHPTKKNLDHAHEAVSVLNDYLATQGAP